MNAIEKIAILRGVTKAELSKRAGISYNTLYRAICGDTRLKAVTKYKIATALGVKVEDIFPKSKKEV